MTWKTNLDLEKACDLNISIPGQPRKVKLSAEKNVWLGLNYYFFYLEPKFHLTFSTFPIAGGLTSASLLMSMYSA